LRRFEQAGVQLEYRLPQAFLSIVLQDVATSIFAVSRPEPYADGLAQYLSGDEERTLVDGPHFTLVHTKRDVLQDRERWVMPLEGTVRSGSNVAGAGECLLVKAEETLTCDGGRMLIGATA